MSIILPIIIAIISAVTGSVFTWLLGRKREQFRKSGDSELVKAHKLAIGEMRGQSQIILIETPTFTIKQLPVYQKQNLIFKRDNQLKSFYETKRRREISQVEFAFISKIVNDALEKKPWIPSEFDRAVRLALEYYKTGIPLENPERFSKEIVIYYEQLREMFENDRLTHLIIPRIEIIDEKNLSGAEKWSELEQYYQGILTKSNMIFISEKDPQVYIDRLLLHHVKTLEQTHFIFEARGGNINNAINSYSRLKGEHPNFYLTRIDFCPHVFEVEGNIRVIKNWLEIDLASRGEMDKFEEQESNSKKFLQDLKRKSEIKIPETMDMFERKKIYDEILQDIVKFGFAVIAGTEIIQTLIIASNFRFVNPEYDYVADLDLSSGMPTMIIVFSSQSIAILFSRFLSTVSSGTSNHKESSG